MTMKKVAPVIGVTAMLIFCWAALSYGADAQPGGQSPPPAAAPNPPQNPPGNPQAQPAAGQETFEFKGKTFVYEDWFGIFSEGKKVGWTHITLNAVPRDTTRAFLYEATEHLEFAPDKVRDTEIKALYGEAYNPIACKRTDQAGNLKSEVYMSGNYTGGALRGFSIKRTVGANTTESSLDLTAAGIPMFDFVAPYYFRRSRVANPEIAEFRAIMDVQSFSVKMIRIAATPLEKEKVAGAEMKVRTVDFGLKKYYFNEAVEPVFVIDFVRNLHMIRGNEAEAEAKNKPEPDYVADPNLNGNVYNSKADGFLVKRPSADWMMVVTKEGAMAAIWMNGLVSDGTAFGLVLPGLPVGVHMPEASARLRQLALARMEKNLSLKIELGEAKPAQQTHLGYTREDYPVKTTSGILSFEGNCAVIMNGNVAAILIYFVPAGTLEQNKDEINKFFDEVRLTPVDGAKNPVYENKAKGFKVEFPGRLWGFTEGDTGLTITNPWYGAYGAIMVREVPKETKLADFAASVLQSARDMSQTANDENGVPTTLYDQAGKGYDAKLFVLSGPMPQTGESSRSRLYVTMNNGIGYAIWIAMPEDAYNRDAGVIDSLIKGFKFLKP